MSAFDTYLQSILPSDPLAAEAVEKFLQFATDLGGHDLNFDPLELISHVIRSANEIEGIALDCGDVLLGKPLADGGSGDVVVNPTECGQVQHDQELGSAFGSSSAHPAYSRLVHTILFGQSDPNDGEEPTR